MSNVQISQLSTVTSVAAGDKIPLASASMGVDAKATMTQVLAFIAANFADPNYTVTISSPIAGFNQVIAGTTNVWLILTPAGTLATGTVTLPVAASCFDGMVVLVTSSQAITTLTVTAGAGTTVVGAPTSLPAGGFFALRYNTLTLTWYCVAQNNNAASVVFSNITITAGILDTNGNEQITFATTAAAVNEITVTNAATGTGPSIAATGGDANIPVTLAAKGSGNINLPTTGSIVSTQGAPGVLDATGTLTAAMIRARIVTSTSAAAVAATLDTGAAMDTAFAAAFAVAVDGSVDWQVINTGPNTFTVTASVGHTIVGAAAVTTATSSLFRSRRTAANTWITYRLD